MTNRLCIITCFFALISLVGCDNDLLRGSVTQSKDGGTYLVVADDNGGACGPMLLDGKPWLYKIGELGPVTSGRHRIECGGWVEFEIPKGVVFKFDYWGP